MKLEIVTVPNLILKQKSKNIDIITPEIKQLIDDMFETMYQSNGVGLAAIQVAKPLNLLVIDVRKKDDNENIINDPMYFINPVIINHSKEKQLMEEGCLSVPGQKAKVMRYLTVEVKYNDINMNELTLKADGLLAHCLQHEIDHTKGIVYIDYLSKMKREFLIKKSKKFIKENKKEV